jgi:hypothetical protein
MEFENRCHKVQEPKFDCLLFGKPLLLCFLQKCCRHVAVLFLLRSVVALFLCPFTECKGFLTCLFLPADLDVKKNIVGEVPLLLLLLAAACFLTV